MWLIELSVSFDFCESIADVRRLLQRISKSCLLVLDESHVELGIAPTRTVVLPDDQPIVEVEESGSYTRRYDTLHCCSINRVFEMMIVTPEERAETEVKGIRSAKIKSWLTAVVARQVRTLNLPYVYVMCDRASIHTKKGIIEAFAQGGVAVTQVILMPARSAKRLSPLDNALFHDWKFKITDKSTVTTANIESRMVDAWNALSAKQIHSHFRNCGLMRGCDVYFDCPEPAVHQH